MTETEKTTLFDSADLAEGELDFEYECLMESLDTEHPYRITGTLGLWDGRHEIEPVVCDNGLAQAVAKCFGESDSVRVQTDGKKYYVDAWHHDGCNHFVIEQWH